MEKTMETIIILGLKRDNGKRQWKPLYGFLFGRLRKSYVVIKA